MIVTVKKNQFCSNEGPRMCLFPREDNNEIVKKSLTKNLKCSPKPLGDRILTYLSTNFGKKTPLLYEENPTLNK